ncbi:MAG: GNAT family N-acetyltransferase [Agromyces sp.]
MLTDGDCSVRMIRRRDAHELHGLLSANRTWLEPWEATYPSQRASVQPSLADIRASIRVLRRQARAGSTVPCVIEWRGRMVGQLNVSSVARGSLSSAVIGYWIAEDAAGQGLTTRAVALITDWCFSSFGLHRMEICVRPENAASQRVVQKLGFRFEGLRRRFIHINGAWADHFCYALVREEVPEGVLSRFQSGRAPQQNAQVPDDVRAQAKRPLL